MRQVGYRQQQLIALRLDGGQLGFQFLDAAAAYLVGGKYRTRILTSLLRARHGLSRSVLVALEPLHLRQQATPLRLKSGKRCKVGGGVKTPAAQTSRYQLLIVSDKGGVQHPVMLYRPVAPVRYDADNVVQCS